VKIRLAPMDEVGLARAERYRYAYIIGNSASGFRLVKSICNLRGYACRREWPWKQKPTER
jgi:hypothetical protein